MKKILIAGILAFALIGITGMSSVLAEEVDINVDDGEIVTHIADTGELVVNSHGYDTYPDAYTYDSTVSTFGGVDVTHIVNVGNSFTVIDEWDGYLGGIDIDTSFKGVGANTWNGNPMHLEVKDSFTTGGLSSNGWQTTTSTQSDYLYVDRSAEWIIGGASGVTDYRSDVWGNRDATFSLSTLSGDGDYYQEQYFRNNEGGTWEHSQYDNRYAVIHANGWSAYTMESSLVDHNGGEYTFTASDSDGWFGLRGGEAELILERNSVDNDGFYLGMQYQGDSYPTASFSGHDLTGTIWTIVDGDEVTMQGTVEGE